MYRLLLEKESVKDFGYTVILLLSCVDYYTRYSQKDSKSRCIYIPKVAQIPSKTAIV